MKQDVDWVVISDLYDPIALLKLIEMFVLKQSNNQYKTAVLIAEQLSILQFCKDDQVTNATYYDHFTTRVEIARQAGVCYYTPDLLDMKATELGMALPFVTLLEVEQKAIIELVEQEDLAYLFLNNSNQKMYTQLKNDVANEHSKGNQDAYPLEIHKALTLMNKYKPLKLDHPVVAAQGMTFATKAPIKEARKGQKEHLWEALHSMYRMYMLLGFRIVVLSGDQEFAALHELAGNLPSAPRLN
jgi:hypothetical protein